jgi:ParB family chromosome partitioning protein
MTQEIQEISLVSIKVPSTMRPVTKARVRMLADSILELGLLQPIAVTPNKVLIYGRHRLEAHYLLGSKTIQAVIVEMDSLRREMATIDENLLRVELTAAQEAKQLARRKEIYEALHPETKKGVAGAKASNRKQGKGQDDTSDNMSFASDTATKTGKTKRTVERSVALGEKLDDKAVEILGDNPITDNKTELKKLAELEKPDQRKVAKKIASGKAETVGEALTGKKPQKRKPRAPKAASKKQPANQSDKETIEYIEQEIRERFDGRLKVAVKLLQKLIIKLEKEM